MNSFAYYVPVRFGNVGKAYYFGTNDETLKPGDHVVVDTVSGFEMGFVSETPKSAETYRSDLELKPVVRLANQEDEEDYAFCLEQAKVALAITEREAKKLGLDMNFINASYTLHGDKITINYTSEGRVDFRELLRILAPQLKCRIELHQMTPRDKAKMVGGMGICGLPLCCSTFLNHFDGISISRAKNQMLTLNIPKLSGACGRLLCCLLYEDDLYTEARADFPRLGETLHAQEGDYKVTSFNILSRSIKLEENDEVKFISLDDYRRMASTRGKPLSFADLLETDTTPVATPSPRNEETNGRGNRPENNRNENPKRDNRPDKNRNRGPKNRPQGQQNNNGQNANPNHHQNKNGKGFHPRRHDTRQAKETTNLTKSDKHDA
ncbi:MAG: regulatory iron-sulfur-containing complex subunit RicT [Erysipelotrichaceae bacterium]|nr:regulatory iron-sulfur-containing complex subunit RicT [Erysipelotrichaceae bacterium]